MSIVKSFLFSPNYTILSSLNHFKNLNICHTSFHFSNPQQSKKRRHVSSLYSPSCYSPVNVDYLVREFSRNGVGFEEIGESCVVKLSLDNGSSSTIMLPSGLITSYKPQMWHGGAMEVLHTSVTEGEDGSAIIRGGVSVELKCEIENEMNWSPRSWTLVDVRGDKENFLQVEMKCSDPQEVFDVKQFVTLHQDLLSSEIMITNTKSFTIQLMGSILGHLTVSTPDAIQAVGLQGSNYFLKPPLSSNFSIIPPNFEQKSVSNVNQQKGQSMLQALLFGGHDRENNSNGGDSVFEQVMENEETDNYASLSGEMSRIYINAPRRFTLIDRGRRNSVVVGSNGYEELYILSPGSEHEWYGRYAFICTGPSALLKPLNLPPGGVWVGGLYLHNPNM